MPRKIIRIEDSLRKQVKNDPMRTFKQIQKDWNIHITHKNDFHSIHLKHDYIALKLQLEFANLNSTAKFCNVCKVIYSGRNNDQHGRKDWSISDLCSKKPNRSNWWYAQNIWSAFKAIDEKNVDSKKFFGIEPFLACNIKRCTNEDPEIDLKFMKKQDVSKSKTDVKQVLCRMKNTVESSNLQ